VFGGVQQGNAGRRSIPREVVCAESDDPLASLAKTNRTPSVAPPQRFHTGIVSLVLLLKHSEDGTGLWRVDPGRRLKNTD
jgi:hypothetical protein